jgi:hypothetical protein
MGQNFSTPRIIEYTATASCSLPYLLLLFCGVWPFERLKGCGAVQWRRCCFVGGGGGGKLVAAAATVAAAKWLPSKPPNGGRAPDGRQLPLKPHRDARGVDVEVDGLGRLLHQHKQLRRQQLRHGRVNGHALCGWVWVGVIGWMCMGVCASAPAAGSSRQRAGTAARAQRQAESEGGFDDGPRTPPAAHQVHDPLRKQPCREVGRRARLPPQLAPQVRQLALRAKA